MAVELVIHMDSAKKLFATAAEILGYDLLAIIRDGIQRACFFDARDFA
jgi:hypothetical protein